MTSQPFGTTVGDWGGPDFAARSVRLDVPTSLDRLPRGRFRPLDELRLFVRVVAASRRYPLLLLYSSRGRMKPELLAIIAIRFMPARHRPKIVLYGEMFAPNRGVLGWLQRTTMRCIDRGVSLYAVHTAAEIEVFSRLWTVSPAKIRPVGFMLRDGGREPTRGRRRAHHVFAGGMSFRHFDPLIEAARRMPEIQFDLCTDQLDKRSDLPPNVRAGSVPASRFVELIESAAVVVVPLRTDVPRITGMFTYLRAMWSGQITIVTSALGVGEFVTSGDNGLIVDGSAAGYVQAISWALDPANAATVEDMRAAARRSVTAELRPERHAAELIKLMEDVRMTQQPTGRPASSGSLVRAVAKRPYRAYARLRHPRIYKMRKRTGGMMPLAVYLKLYEAVMDAPDLDMVEVGAGGGASSVTIAWAMQDSGKTSSLVTVEKCEGGTRDAVGGRAANIAALTGTFDRYQVADRIRLFPHRIGHDNVTDLLALVETPELGAIFHDADGRIDRDFELFWSRLTPGGLIVIDDAHGERPKAIVTRALLSRFTEWGMFELTARKGDTVFGRKPPGANAHRYDAGECKAIVERLSR